MLFSYIKVMTWPNMQSCQTDFDYCPTMYKRMETKQGNQRIISILTGAELTVNISLVKKHLFTWGKVVVCCEAFLSCRECL